MPDVLVVTDDDAVADDVEAAVGGPDVTLRHVRSGREVLPALRSSPADLVVLDLQIGNMGGMATCMDIRLEETADRLRPVAVLMLLDRRADVFLARRCGSDGWLLKPLDPIRLGKAVAALLDGDRYDDETARPDPIAVQVEAEVG